MQISFGLLAMSAALMYAIRTQQVDVQATSLVNIDATCNSTTVFNADTPVVRTRSSAGRVRYLVLLWPTHRVMLCVPAVQLYSGIVFVHGSTPRMPQRACSGAVVTGSCGRGGRGCTCTVCVVALSDVSSHRCALQVVGVNSLFGSMMEWMAAYERHLVTDKMAAAAFRGLFARQFFNTAILVVLINSDVGALLRVFGVEDITKGLAFGSSSLWDVGIPWYMTLRLCVAVTAALPNVLP